ncbi:hypothetical protein GCM10009743_65370 [Kribbella swartbergensis]
MADEYGQLAEKPLPRSEFGTYEISAAEFELAWQGEDGAPNTTLAPSPDSCHPRSARRMSRVGMPIP